jgi:hypothetical protein
MLKNFIESHGAELSNEDLMELEADKVAEQTEADAEGEPVEEPRPFNTKEMAIAFREIASAMARFEKMDPSSSRFLKVNREIDDTLACKKRERDEEKKRATVQSSLDTFARKAERPAPSTSTAPSVPFPAYDEPDDVLPVASPSSSTN